MKTLLPTVKGARDSIGETITGMGISSGANFDHQPSPKMLPPRQNPRSLGLQTSLSLASSDANGSHDMQEQLSNSEHAHEDSPSDSTSSRETWPVETGRSVSLTIKEKEGENDFSGPQVIRRTSIADKLSLREVARERVDAIAQRMVVMPNELLEELKSDLRAILEGTGGPHYREEFLRLQQFLLGREDLTAKTLVRAHRVQLEILVSINTGILAFLHPNVSLSQSQLIEIFLYKRCRNIACQNPIPADDCSCEICARRNGFCNLCMCVICNKFDFEVNTYRWIGCDFCAHWTHSDCAMHVGQIGMGASTKNGFGEGEMHFRCLACNRTSELLGWVKDVFQHCAPGWDREALLRELEFVGKIFHLSEDPRGRKLYRKCIDIVEKMRGGTTESMACRMLMLVFQADPANLEKGAHQIFHCCKPSTVRSGAHEGQFITTVFTTATVFRFSFAKTDRKGTPHLEIESPKNHGNEDPGRTISPKEACNQIARSFRCREEDGDGRRGEATNAQTSSPCG
ncbi:Protein OBERON 1 [Platanthera guangdongensis]|uniref:Protein OBERON 1 n=1 Tax=Platanthera guangdongensis TaxID=2320717 RepID=A0ABR2LCF8_9ASPA